MRHFLNTLTQITRSDSVGVFSGLGRHLSWQLRKALRRFPCELRISRSFIMVDQPGGVAALVNAMGEYDFNNMNLLRLLLSDGERTFVDVGANVGSYSLIASEVPNANVISIEPHPRTFGALLENIKRNERQNVTCLNLAISRLEGLLELTDLGESSINQIVPSHGARSRTLQVMAKPFHAVCDELAINPDFVKIDVEGHEREVLDGFGEWQSRARVIFIEGGERATVRDWMHSAGFAGPYFCHLKQHRLRAIKQARPEDPIYVHEDFLPELQNYGIRISPSVPRREGSNSHSEHAAAAEERHSYLGGIEKLSSARDPVPIDAILMTNCVSPYTLPVWKQLTASLRSFRLLLSTSMESDRHWDRNWDGLDVKLQKSLYVKRKHKHAQGFTATVHLHFPYDSLLLLLRYKPDVVISAQLGFRTLQAVLFRVIRRRSRLVIWVDGSEHTEKGVSRGRTKWRQILLRAADAVITVGASGARYVAALGVPSSKIVEGTQSTDPASFLRTPLRKSDEGARRLLYVGRLVAGKGLENFVEELSRWLEKHPGKSCELWFVGDGPLQSQLQNLPISKSLAVKFIGNVPYSELPEYYAQADACILPTLCDTWGLVVNEALASGVPVLGSLYSQAVEELIKDGANGWSFFPDREGELQRAIDSMFQTNNGELDWMRHVARESIRFLTPQFTAQRFVRAIRLALGERDIKASDANGLTGAPR
jgi:FkbM family methyltransferase